MKIIIDKLSKKYEKKEVLKSVSLTIPFGMYGLLGRNGAGKTSFMRILATLSSPTSGDIVINGVSIKQTNKIREMVGYLPQDFSMYRNMTVYGVMDYLGMLCNIKEKERKEKIFTLLEKLNLKDNLHTKVKDLSGGMKRRLGIAQTLLNEPQILIVDEPTTGLDPEERIRFRNLLGELAHERIVILSTHIAADIEAACENVGVLNDGRLIFNGSVQKLTQQAEGKVYLICAPKEQNDDIKEKYNVLNIISNSSGFQYRVLSDAAPEEIHSAEAPTLEDGYMYLLSHTEGSAK